MTDTPTQIRLANRPDALPGDDTWTITHDAPRAPREGEIAIAVTHLSVDPAMRGWMVDAPSYVPPVQIGEVMRAFGVGEVTASNAPAFKPGDLVTGMTGIQTHYVGSAEGFSSIDPSLARPATYLGGLGGTGLTAYFGLLEVGKPQPGETVVVSAAAGAVGSVVGQIAKIKGARVVGIAGGREKCDWVVNELGFDACVDYRDENVSQALKAACPKGIDVYFDNVGGAILEACLSRLAMHGRIVLCGAISQYNNMGAMHGPSNYMQLLVRRGRMEGFVIFDYRDRFGEAVREMAGWHAAGKLKFREQEVAGIERFPQALRMLFEGKNTGKLVIRV